MVPLRRRIIDLSQANANRKILRRVKVYRKKRGMDYAPTAVRESSIAVITFHDE